jgi:ribonuclease HIII
MKKNINLKIEIEKEKNLRRELESLNFRISELPHAFWRAENENNKLTFYKNGNLLIQGKEVEKILNYLIEKKIIFENVREFKEWIGTDEAGKGDYFGPLVIAGVLVEEKNKIELLKIGVQDSKRLSESSVSEIAQRIKDSFIYSIVLISPSKYNELLEKMKNLNRLLAWGHARVIENILNKKICGYAISDKFGDEIYIKNALLEKGKKINIIQRYYGEEDIAVAGASILARNEFIKNLKEISKKFGLNFPKGAGKEVIEAGKEFVKKFGFSKLREVAKIHFKTTKEIM